MKVLTISKSVVAPLLMMGAVSCTNLGTVEKAKERAVRDMSATELLHAERVVSQYDDVACQTNLYEVAYWDSITTANMAQKAYYLGSQMIKDSIAGNSYTKPEYKLNLDTVIRGNSLDLIDNVKRECAKYYNAEQFVDLRNNVPRSPLNDFWDFSYETGYPNTLHYWNLIHRTFAQRKAFNDGAEAERAKLKK